MIFQCEGMGDAPEGVHADGQCELRILFCEWRVSARAAESVSWEWGRI